MFRTFVALAAALVLPSAWAQEVTLRFHHIWPPGAMASVRVIAPWCEKIAAESKGRMKCLLLPAMSGGGTPQQLVERVKDGVDDLTITLPGYTPGRFPTMEVFELPFMTNSAEAGAAAAWDYLQKHAVKEFPGTHILATWVHDEGYLHTTKRPVTALADFRGLKLRAPTRLTNKLLGRLGATPVGVPVTGVAEAVSKGTIDGFALPWEVLPAFKLHELVKFHTQTDPTRPALYTAVFVFAMNQARYDSLPPDLRKVIDDNSGAALSRQVGRIWDESQAAGRKAAVDLGNKVTTLSAAETDAWIKASAPVTDEWIDMMNKRGQNGAQLVQEAKDLLARYRK